MKKNNLPTSPSGKRPYSPPSIAVHAVEMEQGIAASSVIPTNISGEIREEWEVGDDREEDITW